MHVLSDEQFNSLSEHRGFLKEGVKIFLIVAMSYQNSTISSPVFAFTVHGMVTLCHDSRGHAVRGLRQ